MKRNKGITLVALVVTIIVLVILAGVAINLILGQNGIIGRAKFAEKSMTNAARQEETEIEKMTNAVDNLVLGNRELTEDDIEILTKKSSIAFNMYCNTDNNRDWPTSRFESEFTIERNVKITPVINPTVYLKDTLDAPDANNKITIVSACGIYYRTSKTSNYVRVSEETNLNNVRYIDILVLGYNPWGNNKSNAMAHIEIN